MKGTNGANRIVLIRQSYPRALWEHLDNYQFMYVENSPTGLLSTMAMHS